MPTQVIMPALGMSQEKGRVIAWLKQEGDTIERGEPLIEIETDKTTVEVEAAASGTLANVTAQAGDAVPVGTVIAFIFAQDETMPQTVQVAPTAIDRAAAVERSAAAKHATPVAMRVAQAHGIDVRQISSPEKPIRKAAVEAFISGSVAYVLASPKARRIAHEQGLELAQIQGSGPNGAVLAKDVLSAVQAATPVEAVLRPVPAQTQTGQMWRRMAERLTVSWQTIPHFYLRREINAAGLIRWREQVLSRSEVKITFTDLLVKIVAAALKQHPHVNGYWTEAGIAFNPHINIGLAVVVEEGLLVPVIHAADELGVTAIALRRQELVERALRGKLKVGDLDGGTLTISNLGMYNVDEFSAIVNPPQAAILAVGRISDRIVPVNGLPVVRPMLTLTLSCDHRMIDGARGAQFLNTIAQLIEEPLRLID